MFRTALARSHITRTVVAGRQFHSSPAVRKTVTEKVTEVADKVNKSVGKGLADAIETGEKVADSTKHSFSSTKRKATDTAQDAQGMAKEKMNQASESTKQTTENARRKASQTAGDMNDKVAGSK